MYDPKFEELIEKMAAVAYFHLSEERWESALTALNELIKVKPDVWQFRTMRAEALRHLGRVEEALEDAKLAYKDAPDNDDVAISLAEIYMLNYKFTNAVELLNPVFNKGYNPELEPREQTPQVQRAGFSLAVIQRVGNAASTAEAQA